MNKILYITRHNPWGKGGGSIASRMYLNAFLTIFKNDQIDLCISNQINISDIPKCIINNRNIHIFFVKPRLYLSRILSPITHITHRYQNIASTLMKKKRYTYFIFDHSSIAGSLIRKIPKDSKSIVIHHNYEPSYFSDNAKSKLYRRLLLPTVKKLEKLAFKNCSINLFLTQEDLIQFTNIYGKNDSKNYVSGLFEIDNSNVGTPLKTLKIKTPTLIITGSLNNVQNIDGIKYFIEQLYPLMPIKWRIIISGQNPSSEIYSLIKNKSNICIIPNPDDMSDIVRMGNVFLSPARVGGGIKVRVTDGLRLGLPIIAHSVSSRGYSLFINKGYFKPFNSPQEFKSQLDNILTEIDNETLKSQDISDFYRESYSFDEAISKIKKIIYS